MPRGVPHSAKVRAQVIAAKATGESVRKVAERLGVSRATVERWWATDGPTQPDQRTRTRERMADLIYDTLADILATVRVQLQAATREEWLAQQTAGDLAELLGTEMDRAVRLLAGFRQADADALPDPDNTDGSAGDNTGQAGG